MDHNGAPGTQPPVFPGLAEAARVWARIGLLSFGGPAGQIALMHRELVEERRWIGERRFLHALNYCMLLPGPEAQQLAIYIGWLMHRTAGGLLAGLLFILPGVLVMLGLSTIYAFYHQVPMVAALFLGIKAAVLAIVVEAVLRIGKRALGSRVMVAIAAAAFIGIYMLQVPFPAIVLTAMLVGLVGGRVWPRAFAQARKGEAATDTAGAVDLMFEQGGLGHAEPSGGRALRVLTIWLPLWFGPVALLWLFTGHSSVWTGIATFFSTMAVVTFGGAYAVLSYVAQAAVDSFGWLKPGEMVDGLGLAETTPGPLVLVLEFVGFLAAYRLPGALGALPAGMLGALLTVWVTFAPCFLWVFLGGPYVESLRDNRVVATALAAVSAAVVGVILNLAVWFSLHVVFRQVGTAAVFGLHPAVPVIASLDWRAAVLAFAALVAMLGFKVPLIPTLTGCGLAGLLLGSAFG